VAKERIKASLFDGSFKGSLKVVAGRLTDSLRYGGNGAVDKSYQNDLIDRLKYVFLFVSGATAQHGPGPPHARGL
jgi:hypothetical protein